MEKQRSSPSSCLSAISLLSCFFCISLCVVAQTLCVVVGLSVPAELQGSVPTGLQESVTSIMLPTTIINDPLSVGHRFGGQEEEVDAA